MTFPWGTWTTFWSALSPTPADAPAPLTPRPQSPGCDRERRPRSGDCWRSSRAQQSSPRSPRSRWAGRASPPRTAEAGTAAAPARILQGEFSSVYRVWSCVCNLKSNNKGSDTAVEWRCSTGMFSIPWHGKWRNSLAAFALFIQLKFQPQKQSVVCVCEFDIKSKMFFSFIVKVQNCLVLA